MTTSTLAKEKYRARKSLGGRWFFICNMQPENGRRFTVIGRCLDGATADRIAQGLNRQEARIKRGMVQ